jgi:hypothetical protein
MSNPVPNDDPTKPASDPNLDRDKPQYPAPPASGEHGTGHNPGGSGGAPPAGVKPEVHTPSTNPNLPPTK